MNVLSSGSIVILGAGSDDARVLWSIVALLAVIGVALLMVAVAVMRVSRPDRELLAPLEVMGRRKWRRSDPVWQRRQLDEVRPVGAEPLSVSPAVPVPLDEFDAGPGAEGFDDLDDPTDVDAGVVDDVVVLPGGVAYDADPTPASGAPPAEPRASVPDDESTIAQLGVDWSAPDIADRTELDAPPLLPRRVPRRFPLEPPGLHAAEAAAQEHGGLETTAVDEPPQPSLESLESLAPPPAVNDEPTLTDAQSAGNESADSSHESGA